MDSDGDKKSRSEPKEIAGRKSVVKCVPLPEKQFVVRNSVLTDLFDDVPHIKTIHHIFVAILICLGLSTVAHDYYIKKEVHFGLTLIFSGFGKFHFVLLCWMILMILNCLGFASFNFWAKIRISLPPKGRIIKLWDITWLLIYIAFQIWCFMLAKYFVHIFRFPPPSASIILLEQIRLSMKLHAFIRTSAGPILWYKPHTERDLPLSNFSHYFYFLFAPSDICLKYFCSNSRLKIHSRVHTGERPYKCEFCSKSFFTGTILQRHSKTHTGEKPHKCEICSKSFLDKFDLMRHSKIHTGEKPYKCEICSKCYSCNSHLKTHSRIHTGEKLYKCEICLKSFFDSFGLKRHSRIHTGEKPYKCEICSKFFSCNSHLKAHSRIHTEEKLYKCEICLKSFFDSFGLTRHSKIHIGKKLYKCEVCSKCYSHSYSLRKHSIIHTGVEPYKCEICSKSFSSNGHLKTHFKIHTGEKPYKCEICSKSFVTNSHLTRHLRIHTR